MSQKRPYTIKDIWKLPDFVRVELIDGELCTDDFTELEVDEEVFQNPPSAACHVTYRLSVVKVDRDYKTDDRDLIESRYKMPEKRG